jgi:hypothetical protein
MQLKLCTPRKLTDTIFMELQLLLKKRFVDKSMSAMQMMHGIMITKNPLKTETIALGFSAANLGRLWGRG